MTRNRSLEWWIAIVRLIAIPLAVIQVALTSGYPPGYESAAWALTAGFVLGSLLIFAVVRRSASLTVQILALCFDFAVITGYTILFAFETSPSTRQLLYLAIVTGAARFGLVGGIATAAAAAPVTVWYAQRREHYSHAPYTTGNVLLQIAEGFLIALLVGWLYSRLDEQRQTAEQRAREAENLRDELGRRADLLDAANRCARALSSSLDLREAFGAFIRELRGVVPFERMAIVLVDGGNSARVIATAGAQADEVLPPGTEVRVERSILADVVGSGRTVYRRDLADVTYEEEPMLRELGLRCRVAAPLVVGARAVGMISLGRSEPDGFTEIEVELVGLLGRLVASAVQNIRAYDAERRTVEELSRLSTLRADFVSVVSHELRGPMAAVIGAARTLQGRRRELAPEQREAFLALIVDETTRLSTLVADVLDTSRIDAGTFSYRFDELDLGALVGDAVAAASAGQDEVTVVATVPLEARSAHGDGSRLRQVVGNLIENAVKYSPTGGRVDVRLAAVDGTHVVSVRDEGPGIAPGDQGLIFEKFGRVAGEDAKPGTGLGLYIARSIAEAHGGTLEVVSAPGQGATFTLRLPADGPA
jgi:signal transduction histidine kinase